MVRGLAIALAVLSSAGLPGPARAEVSTLVVYRCAELQTCDAGARCVSRKSRVLIGEVFTTGKGTMRFRMGPLVPDAGGGQFHSEDWRWITGAPPAPGDATGRAYLMRQAGNGVTREAFVYRPGREVRGFYRAGWVRADYTCEQVLF